MITIKIIQGILDIYNEHGWNLSRVLLSDELKNSISDEDFKTLFGNSEVFSSSFNAVWFSRPAKNNLTAWEIRNLNENPYAIFELIDNYLEESEKQEILKKAENRMENYSSNS